MSQRLFAAAAFEDADIRRMAAAYDAALALLHLQAREDPVTELIAAKIIKIYEAGERDPPRLCARALRELGHPVNGGVSFSFFVASRNDRDAPTLGSGAACVK